MKNAMLNLDEEINDYITFDLKKSNVAYETLCGGSFGIYRNLDLKTQVGQKTNFQIDRVGIDFICLSYGFAYNYMWLFGYNKVYWSGSLYGGLKHHDF